MATPILIKRSSVAGKAPATTDLSLGELAINTVDGKLFLKKNVSGTETVVQVGPLTTSDLTEGSNLYFTNARAQSAVTTVTGNAGTATTLQTARNINGVSFNGSADITVTAAAGTLSGATLASGVTASSLTSVGTITSGTWSGSFGAVSGANLTNITGANVTGTVPAATTATYVTGLTAANVTAVIGSVTGFPTLNQNTSGNAATATLATTATTANALNTGNSYTVAGLTTPSVTKSGTSGTGDIGQSANTFGTVYAVTFSGVSTTAKYADLAENYSADAEYAPGTVVMFGGDAEVTLADADTKAVAGVVSTDPAYLMNSALDSEFSAPVALQGRVPCFVVGPVAKGDLMVSAGNGFAKANNDATVGQVIGKALGSNEDGEGVIEVVVGRV